MKLGDNCFQRTPCGFARQVVTVPDSAILALKEGLQAGLVPSNLGW
jgi:hypothetical protein